MKRKDESVGINARDTHGVPGAGCVLMEYGFEQVDLSSALSPNTVCTLCTLLSDDKWMFSYEDDG